MHTSHFYGAPGSDRQLQWQWADFCKYSPTWCVGVFGQTLSLDRIRFIQRGSDCVHNLLTVATGFCSCTASPLRSLLLTSNLIAACHQPFMMTANEICQRVSEWTEFTRRKAEFPWSLGEGFFLKRENTVFFLTKQQTCNWSKSYSERFSCYQTKTRLKLWGECSLNNLKHMMWKIKNIWIGLLMFPRGATIWLVSVWYSTTGNQWGKKKNWWRRMQIISLAPNVSTSEKEK